MSLTRGGYQLRPPDAHRDLADAWPLEVTGDGTAPGHDRGAGVEQVHLRCGAAGCGQSVLCLNPDLAAGPAGYAITPGVIAAQTLAHIRQCHDAFVPVT